VAIGALGVAGVGGLFMLLKHLNLLKHLMPKKKNQENQKVKEEDKNTVKIPIEDGINYICVKSADLEEIKQLLFAFKKEYRVLTY